MKIYKNNAKIGTLPEKVKTKCKTGRIIKNLESTIDNKIGEVTPKINPWKYIIKTSKKALKKVGDIIETIKEKVHPVSLVVETISKERAEQIQANVEKYQKELLRKGK